MSNNVLCERISSPQDISCIIPETLLSHWLGLAFGLFCGDSALCRWWAVNVHLRRVLLAKSNHKNPAVNCRILKADNAEDAKKKKKKDQHL